MSIKAHPETSKLMARLSAIGTRFDAPFEGELFRFINPAFSKSAHIVDGTGALHANGRWNLKGSTRLSYTAMEPETALAEALAHVRYYRLPTSKALPRVLVAVRLKTKRALDLRDGEVRKALRLSIYSLCKLDWRAENQAGREAITQAWGAVFAASGIEAVIAPSAVKPSGANVLVFPENLLHGSKYEVGDVVNWPTR